MSAYRLMPDGGVVRLADDAHIPPDPRNTDWMAYQRWLGDGGVADAAATPIADTYADAITAGLAVTFTTSTALSATYAIDPQTQFNVTSNYVAILSNGKFTNGLTTRYWLDKGGTPRLFNTTQFTALAQAIGVYVDALTMAQATGVPWPSISVAVSA